MSYDNKIHIETINLFRAIKNDESLEVIQILLRKPKTQVNNFLPHCSKEKTCPLIYSAVTGNLEVIKLLLKDTRTDINIKDSFRSSTLIIILLNKNEKEFQYLKSAYIKIIQLLLSFTSFDVNSVNNGGQTALSLAIEKNIEEVVKMLLEHPKINIIQPTESIVNISNKCNNKNIKHYLNSYIVKNQSTLDQQFEQQFTESNEKNDFQQMYSILKKFDKICSNYIIENSKTLMQEYLLKKMIPNPNILKMDLETKKQNLDNKETSNNNNMEKSKVNKKLRRNKKKKLLQVRNKFWILSFKKRIFELKKESQIFNNWYHLMNTLVQKQTKQKKEQFKLFQLRERFWNFSLQLKLLNLKNKINEFYNWYYCDKWHNISLKLQQHKVKQKYDLRKKYILARCKIYNLIILDTFNKLCSYLKQKKMEQSMQLCSLQAARKIENKQLLDSIFKFKQYIYKITLQKKQQNLINKFKQSNNVKHLRYIFINLKKYLQYQKNKSSKSSSSLQSIKYQERPHSKFVWIEDYEHPKSWYIVEENYYLQLVESQNYYHLHLNRKGFQNYNYFNQSYNHILF